MADVTGSDVEWPPASRWRAHLLRGVTGLLLLPAWVLAVLLVGVATTWAGRLMGLQYVLLGVVWDAWTAVDPAHPDRAKRRGAVALLAVGLCLSGAVWLAPDGRPRAEAPLQHVWTGDTRFEPWLLSNLTPEIDQFLLGTLLVPWLDPFVDMPQARRLSSLLVDIYGAQRADPDAFELGSVMHLTYQQLFGFGPGRDHLFQRKAAQPPRAVVLFIHGSAGPFRGYQEALAPLADAGVDIVSPTFGFGNWHHEGGVETLEDALDWVQAQPRYRNVPVVVAGLSNGGYGVSRIAAARAAELASLVYISPVLTASDAIHLSETLSAELPVHIVHGAADRRIPLTWLDANADVLRRAGWSVERTVVEDEDHFLLFSQPDAVVEVVLAAVGDAAGR